MRRVNPAKQVSQGYEREPTRLTGLTHLIYYEVRLLIELVVFLLPSYKGFNAIHIIRLLVNVRLHTRSALASSGQRTEAKCSKYNR